MFDLFFIEGKVFSSESKVYIKSTSSGLIKNSICNAKSDWWCLIEKTIFFSILLPLSKKSQSFCCLKTFMFASMGMQTHIIRQCLSRSLRSLFFFYIDKDLLDNIGRSSKTIEKSLNRILKYFIRI